MASIVLFLELAGHGFTKLPSSQGLGACAKLLHMPFRVSLMKWSGLLAVFRADLTPFADKSLQIIFAKTVIFQSFTGR